MRISRLTRGIDASESTERDRRIPREARLAITFLLTASFFTNEVLGSFPIYISISALLIFMIAWPALFAEILSDRGIMHLWLVPLFACLSVFWSINSTDTIRNGLELIVTVFACLLISRIVSPRELFLLIGFECACILFASAIVNHRAMDALTGQMNWTGVFMNKNSMCFIGALFAFFCLYRFVIERGKGTSIPFHWIWLSLGITAYASCFAARSVAIIAATSASMLLYFVLCRAYMYSIILRRRYVVTIVLVIIILGVPSVILLLIFKDEVLGFVNKDTTLTGRTVLWYWADRISLDRPWLGFGYRGFWVQGVPSAEYLWKIMHVRERYGFHFHSIYYEMKIELGYIGIALISLEWVISLRRVFGWLVRTHLPEASLCFSLIFMIFIIEFQAVDLYMPFIPIYLLYVVAIGFASQTASLMPSSSSD